MSDPSILLEVSDLSVAYGQIVALRGVSLSVREGQVAAVLGPNGAGKSTLLQSIAGLLVPRDGVIRYRGENVEGERPESIVRRGISLVPEGRRIFSGLTVSENLRVGAISRRDGSGIETDLEDVYEMFPILFDRREQPAQSLSGGEQQMLAIGRSMMSRPALMLLDEPSLGLAPIVVDRVFDFIAQLRDRGVTVLLVEQNVHRALEIAHTASVLAAGAVVLSGSGTELREREEGLERAYLGIGGL